MKLVHVQTQVQTQKTLNLPKLAVLVPESADQKHVIEV
jgi:hypothetical protein